VLANDDVESKAALAVAAIVEVRTFHTLVEFIV